MKSAAYLVFPCMNDSSTLSVDMMGSASAHPTTRFSATARNADDCDGCRSDEDEDEDTPRSLSTTSSTEVTLSQWALESLLLTW